MNHVIKKRMLGGATCIVLLLLISITSGATTVPGVGTSAVPKTLNTGSISNVNQELVVADITVWSEDGNYAIGDATVSYQIWRTEDGMTVNDADRVTVVVGTTDGLGKLHLAGTKVPKGDVTFTAKSPWYQREDRDSGLSWAYSGKTETSISSGIHRIDIYLDLSDKDYQ
ncbi:MAG TPA: hypothetical protein VN372_01245 [Methanospirillum sp.]|nr:hypothetical protein [Methanospirillum sp.]